MKRQRSSVFGEDFDDDGIVGEKLSLEWPRKEPDADRSSLPSSSSHRRHPYSRAAESPRTEASSSHDRAHDDEREPPPRSLRRRHDPQLEHFDWRKGYDRHRDASALSSSPRRSYGSERTHRVESFSGLRREVPKGFRSERDRSRREGSSGSWSWWKSRSSKDLSAEEVWKSPSVDSDSAGRRWHAASPDDHRGRVRSRDFSSGDQSSKFETKSVKSAKPSRESDSCRSEMEEGELEPDPQPEAGAVDKLSNSKAAKRLESDYCRDGLPENNIVLEEGLEKKGMLLDGKKLDSDGNATVDEKDEGKLAHVPVEAGNASDEVRNHQSDAVNVMDENNGDEEGNAKDTNGDNKVKNEFCGKKQEVFKELVGNKEEQAAEEELKQMEFPLPPLQGENLVGNMEESQHDEAKVEVKHQHAIESSISSLQEVKLIENYKDKAQFDAGKHEMASSISPQEDKLVENMEEARCCDAKALIEQEHETGNEQDVEAEIEIQRKHEKVIELKAEQKELNCFYLETEPEGAVSVLDQNKGTNCETNNKIMTLALMKDQIVEKCMDKGKSIVISPSTKSGLLEGDDALEGPSGRGFELFFQSGIAAKVQSSGKFGCHFEAEKLKYEPLDLSLALPVVSSSHSLKQSKIKPEQPSCARGIQTFPSSFRTNSDEFTTSISFIRSQPIIHNLSCIPTQNTSKNHDHLIGSCSIFQGVDQASSGTTWLAQTSNDSKRKGCTSLFQSQLLNGNSSQRLAYSMTEQHESKPNSFFLQSSLPRQISPTNIHGSHDTGSQHGKGVRLVSEDRSCKIEQWDGELLVLNGLSNTEKIVAKIVEQPLHLSCRMLQEMTDHMVACLKETIVEILVNTYKSELLHVLQEALQRKPDIMMDALVKCPSVLLEILVSIKTGLPDFLQRTNRLSPSDLVEIFLNLKCRNVSCRNLLPVDDCDCDVCIKKSGFCSACMCLVCSKFDNASNTCSWVGCDVCLHWCHTDCGLRDSHIRNGKIAMGEEGITEMQFHCFACGHPSEMFGFAKEVFRTCAMDWNAETLTKELQYVRRIFSTSNDVRGKRLHELSDQMLLHLVKKGNHTEVVSHILAFLSDSVSDTGSSPLLFPPMELSRNDNSICKAIACSSKEWLESSTANSCLLGSASLASSKERDMVGRKYRDTESQLNGEKKPAVDELERLVKFKQVETKMYQERADGARKEAESLKHIAIAKNSKIDEDYAIRIEKLQLGEVKERCRQKLQELQAIERAHQEYRNMKMRMEADIKDLLLKMEATSRNLNA